jgi:tellurium resistance protein TerD
MINLQKKQVLNLAKSAPGLSKVIVGLSWDPAPDGRSPDADASVFMLGENSKIPDESCFVFYNNLTSGDGSVKHAGDNRTGDGDGDDEQITIDLGSVAPNIAQLVIVITIHNMEAGFHFGNILNSSVSVYDMMKGSVICQYSLAESYDGCDSLLIGRFYRSGATWEFEALGHAFAGGLAATVELYT